MCNLPRYAVSFLFSLRVCVWDIISNKDNNCLTGQQDPVVFCTCWKLQTCKVSKLREYEGDDAEKQAEGEQQGCNWLELSGTWAPLNTCTSWLLGCSCVCVSLSSGGCFLSSDFELRKIWAHENKTQKNNCEKPLMKISHRKIYWV